MYMLFLPWIIALILPVPPDTVYQDIYFRERNNLLILGNRKTEIKIDRQTGAWTSWVAEGLEGDLLTRLPEQPPTDFSINGQYQIARHGSQFIRQHISIDKDRKGVVLSVTMGILPDSNRFAYELTMTYRLFPNEQRLERSARLLRLKPGSREHLDGFRFQLPGVTVGPRSETRLTVPGPFFTKTFVAPETPHDSIKTKKMGFHSAPDAGFGLLILNNPVRKKTLGSWMSTGGEVAYHTSVQGNGQVVTFRHDDKRAYYLTPGLAVESDVHHLHLTDKPADVMNVYSQMVSETMPLDKQTPDWVKEQVILEIYPKYFPGGLKQLTARLPFYKEIGFTMIYLMPHWTGGYSPIDPFQVEPKFGSEADLKALVSRAHQLGMKVIFDMVIHGFNKASPLPRQRPELFVRNEGDTLALHPTWKSVTTDWAAPAYQQYMVDLVLHDQRTYGIDGYRVDAATYKGAGWNPNVPYPAYRDGSAAPELMKRMLSALQRQNPEAVLLSEVFGPVFYSVCNFVHDNQTEAVPLLLEKMSRGQYQAAQYQTHMANVYASLPEGANRVFYARNHDTDWFYTFGGYTPQFMAFEAVHALFGIPEVFAGDPDYPYNPDKEPATFATYKKLFDFRKKHPEFIKGRVQFDGIASSSPSVFCGIRAMPGRRSVALISFSDQPQQTTVTMGGGRARPTAFIDIQTGQAVAVRPTGDRSFVVTLRPFQQVAGEF